MEKRPISFSENITTWDKLCLLCLVFFAPLGLILLFSKCCSRLFWNLNVLFVLSAAWINWFIWVNGLDNLGAILLATVINSLPFAAYFFLLEERKFYSVKSNTRTFSDVNIVVIIPLLSLQLTAMMATRISGVDVFSKCSDLVKLSTLGMIFTLVVFVASLKHFARNSSLLASYFKFIPDNSATLWLFSVIGIVVIIVSPAFVKGVPSILYLFGCF